MPLYLCEADWNAALPLDQVLEELDELVQRSGGQVLQVLQVLQVDIGLSLTIEVPDEVSLFRVAREASALGLELSSRVALPRIEAEALDRAHRERTQ